MKVRNKLIQRFISLTLAVVMVLSSFALFPTNAKAAVTSGTTYYVSNTGKDTNSGTAENKAFKTLEKVNSMTFKPGDKLLFKSGDEWVGQLAPKGSGKKGAPIVIGKYGGTARPLIQGNGLIHGDDTAPDPKQYNATVQFYNQQYWEITSLEITNYSDEAFTWKTYNESSQVITQTNKIQSKYGILIIAKDNGISRHMYIQDCDIHDVNGDTTLNRGAGIGRGGIVYMIRGKSIETSWDDILVEGNKIGRPDDGRKDPEGNHAANITSYGVSFVSTWCGAVFPHESGIPNQERASRTKYSTNLVFRNNYLVDVGNAAICPSGYENAVLENNVSDHCNSGVNGNVPFWWQLGDNTIAQYNEVFGTGAAAAKEDSQAFDGDLSAKENIVQYNYTHDNPSGSFFECALGTVFTTHYRYNISQNDGDGYNSHGKGSIVAIGGNSTNAGSKLYVYNNDMIVGKNHIGLMANAWESISDDKKENYVFENNLMYSDGDSGKEIGGKKGGTKVKGWEDRFYAGSTVDNNYYGGSNLEAIDRGSTTNTANTNKDEHPVYGDIAAEVPGLVAASQRTKEAATGWDKTESYKRASVAVPVLEGSGKVIPFNGGLDFYGNYVSPFAKPSIGAHETQQDLAIPADKKMIDFKSTPAGSIAGTSFEGMKFTKNWKANDQEEVFVNSDKSESTANKITIPAGYNLYGFSAKTTGGSAIVTVTRGEKSKTFYLSSVKNAYLTNYTGASSGAETIYVTVKSPAGANAVSFDNFILTTTDVDETPANLALNKPATQNNGYNDASFGNDGKSNTMAGNTGTFPYIWQVDLEDKYRITRAEIEWESLYTGEKNNPDPGTWGDKIAEDWKYKVSYSVDNTNWEVLWDYTSANPNTDPETSLIQGMDTSVAARYLKVEITGKPSQKPDAWAVLPEFRAFGTKWFDNVALKKAAGQNLGADAPQSANNVVDGKENTKGGGRNTQWLPYEWYVDLGAQHNVDSAEIIWEDYVGDKDWKYKIEYAIENEDQENKTPEWKTLVDYTAGNPNKERVQTAKAAADTIARYFKVTVTGVGSTDPGACYISEFKVFGELSQKTPENVALNKTATQTEGSSPASNAVDGDLSTWAGNTPNWGAYKWMVDLGKEYDIDAIETYWGYLPEKAEDVKYKIEYATKDQHPIVGDDDGWETYVDYSTATPYANNPETSRIQTIRKEVTARYFRVTLVGKPTGSGWWAVINEFRAYGKANGSTEVEEGLDTYNIAYGKPVKASVNQDSAEHITDAQDNTAWESGAGDWARIDMGLGYNLEDVELTFDTAPERFTVLASEDGENYAEIWNFDEGGNTEKTVKIEVANENIRYFKIETGDAFTKIISFAAHGEEVPQQGKTVMIFAPHPDDEVLLGGGVINRAINDGNDVYVVVGTLGDYNNTGDTGSGGRARMRESIAALQTLGVPVDHMLFLGYGDLGGLKQFGQSFTGGMLYQLFTAADEDAVIPSRHGTQTYGGVLDSWHKKITGAEGDYTRANFVADMQAAVDTFRPDEIYTTSRFDLHSDHAMIGMFVGEAVINTRRIDSEYQPKIYETVIHSCEGDNGQGGGTWPDYISDAKGIKAHRAMANLEHTPLEWSDRVSFTVPEEMRVTPFDYNLKNVALKKYTSQYYDYIGAFSKFDEFFWERDYGGIGYFAEVEASSEDTTGGASAKAAVDGIQDGYSTSLKNMYPGGAASGNPLADHDRFPFAEWVSEGTDNETLTLTWDKSYDINKVILYDRPDTSQNITAATITFKAGETEIDTVGVGELENDGRAYIVDLDGINTAGVTSLVFTVTGVSAGTTQAGLAELEVYGDPVKIPPTIDEFTFETMEDPESGATILVPAVYSGQEHTYAVTPKTGVGAVTVYYNGSKDAPKLPGTYEITIDAEAGSAYQEITDLKVGDFVIGKAPLTITADSVNMTKGDPLPTYSYTVTGIVEGETKEDALVQEAILTCDADGETNGEYDIVVSDGEATDNYTIAAYVNGVLTVSDAALTGTLVIDNTTPKIGDKLKASLTESNNTGSLTYTWKVDDTEVELGETYEVTKENLGKSITVSVTSDVETGVIVSAPTELVGKKMLTAEQLEYAVTDGELKSVVYNGKAQAFKVVPKVEDEVGTITTIYYNGSTLVPRDAGSYQITVDVAAGDIYDTATSLELGDYVIKKAPLTIVAMGAAMIEGGTLPNYTHAVVGMVMGEGPADALATLPTVTCAADGSTPGVYEIVISGGEATDNYEITSRLNGTLQVLAGLQITGTVKITPNAPKVGDKLSASLSDTNSMGALTYLWKVNGVHAGTGVYYVVTPKDVGKKITAVVRGDDKVGEVVAEVTVNLVAPSGVKAAQSKARAATITWEQAAGAQSYTIYRSTSASKGFKKIGTTSKTSFEDKKASYGKTWYYKVAATASGAKESPQSKAAKISMLKNTKIKASSPAKGQLKVTWKKVSGADGYDVQVSTKKFSALKSGVQVKKASTLKLTLKKKKSKQTYYVKVRAYKMVNGKKVYGELSKIYKVKTK